MCDCGHVLPPDGGRQQDCAGRRPLAARVEHQSGPQWFAPVVHFALSLFSPCTRSVWLKLLSYIVDVYHVHHCPLSLPLSLSIYPPPPPPPSDGLMAELCHAPISPSSVQHVLKKFDLKDGYFMVKESRSKLGSFTLSLCYNGGIMNYRYNVEQCCSRHFKVYTGVCYLT